jgi:hypothetical protein
MSLSEFCESPSKALAVIAILAIIGVIVIGILSFYVQAKTLETLNAVVKILEAVLIATAGAKAGLATAGKKEKDNPPPIATPPTPADDNK